MADDKNPKHDDFKTPAPVGNRRKRTNPLERMESSGRMTLEDDSLDRHRHV